MKAKKLTLDETWRLCLSMWRWIARQKKLGNRTDINSLKREWLANNGYSRFNISANCFFCEYKDTHPRKNKYECEICPGALVDKHFRCCDKVYHHKRHPITFYNKLVSLNRKRKKAT